VAGYNELCCHECAAYCYAVNTVREYSHQVMGPSLTFVYTCLAAIEAISFSIASCHSDGQCAAWPVRMLGCPLPFPCWHDPHQHGCPNHGGPSSPQHRHHCHRSAAMAGAMVGASPHPLQGLRSTGRSRPVDQSAGRQLMTATGRNRPDASTS
jgi:hypothetical protein